MHIRILPLFYPPLSSTCWIPDSDSGDLEKSKKGCGFLKVCQKPWGLGMIGISIGGWDEFKCIEGEHKNLV